MRRLTLRARLLLIGLLGLVVALGVGATALYGVLWYSGLHSLDRDANATAAQVTQLVRAGHLPDPIPVTGDQIVQVLDHSGRVVSASVNGDRLTAMLPPRDRTRAAKAPIRVPGSQVGVSGDLRVTAMPVSGTDRTVVVAQSLAEVQRGLRTLRNALLVAFPLLLLLLALIAWRVIGATLRPVEELRAGAERISGSGREERLPVPHSADEIGALAVTLNSMLDRLADSRERQRSFVADVAHELRSPLASIRTQLEIAQHLGEGSPLLDELHAEALRMGALVEDLLTLARLDADAAPPPAAVPVSLAETLAAAVDRYAGGPVTVAADIVAPTLVAAVDPDELTRVVDNLVENALRHASEQVRVAATTTPAGVLVSVDDDGPGIAESDRARVLERFTRLDQARARDVGGSGLGLAIVNELVRRRHGRLHLDTSTLGGLRVEVTLPCWQD